MQVNEDQILNGGDDRRRDHCSVDPGRPPASAVSTLEPLPLTCLICLICLLCHRTSTPATGTAVITRGE